MKRVGRVFLTVCLKSVVVLSLTAPVSAQSSGLDTAMIERLTGAKGKFDEKEGVFKVSAPRSDLNVTVTGVKMTPPLGLTSWAGFTKAGKQTLVMGDMVLLEDQVNPAMSVALDNDLEVTALHNHFLWDSPKVMFMHIAGTGDAQTLASAVGMVFSKIRETSGGKGATPRVDIDPARTSLNPAKIEKVLGVKGELNQGVYKVTIGRTARMHGHEIGNTMGVNTWAAFAGADDLAVVDGDFVMYESELLVVLKALRAAKIDIVAIHNHMTNESPRNVFLHYWGIGPTEDLARGIKSALDKQKK